MAKRQTKNKRKRSVLAPSPPQMVILRVCMVLLALLLAAITLLNRGSDTVMNTAYPRKYDEYVTYYAGKYQIDPYILYSIIRTESNFNPQAESNVGARGLMQITRQRVRPVAVQDVTDVCPTCNGTGRIEPTVLLDKKIENKISYLAQDAGHKYIKLRVSPYVSTYLNHGLWSLRRRWMWKYKIQLKIVADQSVGIVDVHYYDKEGKDLYKD
jgi:soluble lytic murein transglycosylase-like protein